MKRARKVLVVAALTGLAVVLLSCGWFFFRFPDVGSLAVANPTTTAVMEQRRSAARRAGKPLTITQHWVALQSIPLLLRRAVIITEDASFYSHHGIDVHETKESLRRDWRERRFVRGGSTITQQLAKNLFLSTRRTPLRKIEEFLIARRLEQRLSKDRILHLYLNLIEFGPGVFGVEAAARRYFRKPVTALAPEEIIRLVAVIPRPLSTSPTAETPWMRWRTGWIRHKLELYGYLRPPAVPPADDAGPTDGPIESPPP